METARLWMAQGLMLLAVAAIREFYPLNIWVGGATCVSVAIVLAVRAISKSEGV